FCVTNNDRLWTEARRIVTLDSEAVDVCGQIRDLIPVKVELRHGRETVAEHVAYQLATLVVEDNLRPQQIGSTIAPTGIVAMTKRAVRAVEKFSAFQDCGIGLGTVGVTSRDRVSSSTSLPAPPLRIGTVDEDGHAERD